MSGVITLGAMVATPLAARGGPVRRVLSSVVVVGSCATTLANATRRWGLSRSVGAAATVAVATTLVEHVGSSTGRPFGRYRYTEALRPQVAGVPVVVPMAWFAMALPARESAHGALGALGAFGAPGRRSTRAGRVALGSAALTAWDLFLDPQMVAEGYWVWARRGAYRGIPLTNYLGWFLTGLGVMAILEALLPAGDQAEPALVAEYGVMGVMETIGFARFFRDPVVAAAGAIGMLPIAAAAHVAGSRGGA